MIRLLCGLWAFVRTATYPDHIPLTAKWQGRDLDLYGAGAHLLWFPGSWAAGDENAAVDWAAREDDPAAAWVPANQPPEPFCTVGDILRAIPQIPAEGCLIPGACLPCGGLNHEYSDEGDGSGDEPLTLVAAQALRDRILGEQATAGLRRGQAA